MPTLYRDRVTRQLRIERAGMICCRGTGLVRWGGRTVQMSRSLADVLFRLMRGPGCVTKDELSDWIYGDRLDGGPLTTRVRAKVHHLRATLDRHGFPVPIATRHAMGYEFREDLMSEYSASELDLTAMPSAQVDGAYAWA